MPPLETSIWSESAPLVSREEFIRWIIFEDDDVLVLNKPGWLVCHPSKNGPWSSLVGAAKQYLGVESIHLASRLDRETSGCVLLAKHKKSARTWQKGTEDRLVSRSYLAILRGCIKEKISVFTYLGNDPTSKVFVKQRVTEESKKSKQAETLFTPLICQDDHTFCLVFTETGRKHQIRVHAQYIGHMLVGEKLYGDDENYYLEFCEGGWKDSWLPKLGMCRQALHGRSLCHHQQNITFHAPVPKDFLHYLAHPMGLDRPLVEHCLREADSIIESRNKVVLEGGAS
jgi:23S rRNA pseudouridine1911/1915/1917 synthase